MCKMEKCERHEFDKGLCLIHLREAYAPVEKPKRKRSKKVDAVEVATNDDTTELETREAE